MKKLLIKTLLLISSIVLSSSDVFASTIITAPIDSRPISIEYLKNLADISGDKVLYPDKSILDYFSSVDSKNRFADSVKVREEINTLVSENNSSDTSVIINSSSYFTNGLVGSRCGINYTDYDKGLEDLYKLITEYPEPTYYINIAMPRNLPETRLNEIWRSDNFTEPLKGLGYYYLKYVDNTPNKEYISKTFSTVTPAQYLIEWGYIENKKYQLGAENITPWETDFLDYFEYKYKNNEPYKSYLYKYILPQQATAYAFQKLLRWQNEGLIDEIIICNDDLQLPTFITYVYNNEDNEWINRENSSPIKFSFSKKYVSDGPISIYKQLVSDRGETETNAAMNGKGKNINFIFGTDEIPQLIYARDLSKRKGITTDIKPVIPNKTNSIAAYDVINSEDLLKNSINFVSYSNKKTEKKFDLYMYNYNNSNEKLINTAISMINESYNSSHNIGLIELYSNETMNLGNNDIFKALLSNEGDDLNITNLSSYSAWNTNANAIGLGTAHSQVFGIAEETSADKSAILKPHLKVLGQHIIEDGIFTIQLKRQLTNEKYIPTVEDAENSQKLYDLIKPYKVSEMFEKNGYELNNKLYDINKFEVTELNFPWQRLFECYIDIDINISEN